MLMDEAQNMSDLMLDVRARRERVDGVAVEAGTLDTDDIFSLRFADGARATGGKRLGIDEADKRFLSIARYEPENRISLIKRDRIGKGVSATERRFHLEGDKSVVPQGALSECARHAG